VAGGKWLLTYKTTYPDAVHNESKTEYILSCNDGSGKLTRKEAQDYISENWQEVNND
jgi:hypothetical protein